MSTVGTAAKLAKDVLGKGVHVVSHPVESAAFAAGLARGAAWAVTRRAHGGATDRNEAGAPGSPASTASPAAAAGPAPGTERPAKGEWVPPRPGERLADAPEVPAGAPAGRQAVGGAEAGPAGRVSTEHPAVTEDPDVETPVGTTGAGSGYNPDTTETDLQQPGTEPLMDPSLTKSVQSEAETLRKAADPDKS